MTGDAGKIRYPARSTQLIDFSGVRFGNATPSNVDGLLEIKGKLFVVLEYKHTSAQKIPLGQRMMIERLADQLGVGDCCSIAIIATHDAPVGKEIDGANAVVCEIRWKGKWLDFTGKNFNVRQCVDRAYQYAFAADTITPPEQTKATLKLFQPDLL